VTSKPIPLQILYPTHDEKNKSNGKPFFFVARNKVMHKATVLQAKHTCNEHDKANEESYDRDKMMDSD
jgi:hypothetical protein